MTRENGGGSRAREPATTATAVGQDRTRAQPTEETVVDGCLAPVPIRPRSEGGGYGNHVSWSFNKVKNPIGNRCCKSAQGVALSLAGGSKASKA